MTYQIRNKMSLINHVLNSDGFWPAIRHSPSFFDDHFSLARNSTAGNLVSSESDYTIKLPVPGYGQEDLSLEIDEHYGTLSVKSSSPPTDGHFHWSRSVPSDVDYAAVSASIDKGVLTVHLPRVTKDTYTRQIEIK